MNKNWYAVYTKSLCEKKVAALLSKKRIENFHPQNRISPYNGNGKKIQLRSLFPSFVFVYISDSEMQTVLQTNDVINFIYWLGKPAVINMNEIENISHFTGSYCNIEIEKITVNPNGIIKVSKQPDFELNVGVLSLKNTKIKLTLPSLGFAMIADSEKSSIDSLRYRFGNARLVS